MKFFNKIVNSDIYISRWLVLIIDLIIVANTFILAYLIRYNFTLNFDTKNLYYQLPTVLIVSLFSFLIIGSYKGIVRHTGVKDAYNVFFAAVLISFTFSVLFYANKNFNIFRITIPRTIIAIHFLLNVFVLIGSRFVFKQVYHNLLQNREKGKKVLIYGAGSSGLITYMALSEDVNKQYKVIGFIDDNKDLANKKLKGLPIYLRKKIDDDFLEKSEVDEIIISIQNIENKRLLSIVDGLLVYSVKVKTVPPVQNWINGKLKTQQISEIKVEDLLQRKPIKIFNETLEQSFHDKIILVTGAAGSIGREIAKQLTEFSYNKLLLLDQAESPLYELQMEFLEQHKNNVEYCIADVSDKERLKKIFDLYKIDYIFHAAAYKHVPLMEENPYEAIKVNIFGTKNLMDLAVEYQVEKFVMVSTDKAVNPTNVMGATKRVAELYAQHQNTLGKTKFVTTRFGNVLGSNGSVIPLFKKQIDKGGPLTVTHPEIIRYFMTIPEACNLVLEAGVMGNGGEIYVFDMGESVKIFDLAKNMIRLAGYKYPEEINIVFTGLRPGEKLYEELLGDKEKTMPTYHEKIMIAILSENNHALTIDKISELQSFKSKTNLEMVKIIKQMVPEYISENSVFKELD